MWNISKLYLLFVILIANFSLNAQLILTTSAEVDLKENSTEPTKVLRKVPAHKNVEFIDYTAFDDYNGMFKIRAFGIIGYINLNDVIYDDNFYLGLKAASKEVSLKDTKVLEQILGTNRRKIREEEIWAKQIGFEHEDFKELMTQLGKSVPVKPKEISTNDKVKPNGISDDKIKNEKETENNLIVEKQINDHSKTNHNCLMSISNYNNVNENKSKVTTTLTSTTEATINNEFQLLKKFFNIQIELIIMNFERGPCYVPDMKLLVADSDYLNYVSQKTYGNERVKAILAHEFAHALQHEAHLFDLWNGGKKIELHADFLAGYYMGRNGLISKEKLTAFANEFYSVGDKEFDSPDPHGTPEERRCAFLEGFKTSVDYDFNIYQAFNAGVDYIKLLYSCDPFAIIREYSKTEYNNTNYTLPTGSYIFSSSQENMVFCNLYRQPLGEASPGKDLQFNNLTPGSYIVIPAKKLKSGKLKYFAPYTFDVKENHTGQLKINKVGLFVIKSYLIVF